tara:strand:- start:14105 stop:15778 length:1674 start_codon:yes stop_codon:yes gene_type:complete
MARNNRRNADYNSANYWPGFVDAMATILLVIIFLLTVFILSQFFLSTEISDKDVALENLNNELEDKDDALEDLNNQLQQLSSILALEEAENQSLKINIQTLESEVTQILNLNQDLNFSLEKAENNIILLRDEIEKTQNEFLEAQNNIVLLQDEIQDINAEYSDQIILLEDEIKSANKILNDTEDELANKNTQIIKLVAEKSQIVQLLNIKDTEIRSKSLKIENYQSQISSLELKTNELEEELAQNKITVVDLRDREQKNVQKIKEFEKNIDLLNISSSDLANINSENERLIIDLRENNSKNAERINILDDLNAKNEQIIIDLRKKESENDATITNLKSGLVSTANRSRARQDEITLLNIQVAELNKQLGALQALLDESKDRDTEQQARIADLGRELNTALAQKVKDLSEYRSEFFGKIKEIIGDRDDIEIVGDRFVFKSDVLFDSGSAELSLDGQRAIVRIAVAIDNLMEDIPDNLNWVIRIDGHTDKRPIKNSVYTDNWDLSFARAKAVVGNLTQAGIPIERIAATARGDSMPIDNGDNEEAYAKNRRIEIRLTES